MTSMNPRRNIDSLFDEFIREMDDFCTNGVVKSMDYERVLELVQHFIAQCSSFRERMELEERMAALLQTKYDFALAEAEVEVSRRTDRTIREKIKEIVARHLGNATRNAGLFVQWALLKPLRIIRSVVEPAVANTVLTYSLAVHPPYVDTYDLKTVLAPADGSEISSVETQNKKLDVSGLSPSTEYSDDMLSALTSVREPDVRKPVGASRVASASATTAQPVVRPESEKLKLDIERRTLYSAGPTLEEKQAIQRKAEQRPIGEVQNVFANNSFKIYNSIRTTTPGNTLKNPRIGVQLVVTAKGVVKSVVITSGSLDKAQKERVTLQLRTLRFTEVPSAWGDQVVYHTFYF